MKLRSLFLMGVLAAGILACNPVRHLITSESVLRWEADIAVFDSLNMIEFQDENTLLVTGSSSIRLWDNVHEDLAPFSVVQRGYGGAKLSDYNYYADRIIVADQYKAIVLFIANDIDGSEHGRTPEEMFLLFKTLARKVMKEHNDTPLFWVETTPTPSRWHVWPQAQEANRLIREYCDQHDNLHFITTSPAYLDQSARPDSSYFRKDMLHMNGRGYAQWTGIILDALDAAGIRP